MAPFDVIVIGAGGAGLMCAIEAGKRGRSVLLLDHSPKVGQKILISGGGRCNFTNMGASPANYVSQNPHFCKSALSRYPARSFIEWIQSQEDLPFHEKKLGQLFFDRSARDLVAALERECAQAGVETRTSCRIEKIEAVSTVHPLRFKLKTSLGEFECESLVIATGGLSIPKIGATGFGYEVARQFGLKVVEPAPALDGFTFEGAEAETCRNLSGVSVDCRMEAGGMSFRENLLFTHSGMSGPAALQASLHWKKGMPIRIDLLPDAEPFAWFQEQKKRGNRSVVKNLLGELLPSRLAERLCELEFPSALPLPQVSEKALEAFCAKLKSWTLQPTGTVGYNKAEVTRGGVDTDELSSKTMEARKAPGLYFIGEVVDVTGWLGGYNLQWAWSSGWCAGQVV